VDGFSGGGIYSDGTSGSPLIFIEELINSTNKLNISRAALGASQIDISCLLILNDHSPDAIQKLKSHIEPMRVLIAETCPRLDLQVIFHNREFEDVYLEIKSALLGGRYQNLIFNLDPCGHTNVNRNTLVDIVGSFRSVEVFYTLMIESLIAFLQKSDPAMLKRQLRHVGLAESQLGRLDEIASRNDWLGTAESIVFEAYQACAPFVSPFSINNPDGWRYWLLHFSNMYRARQVYNNVLHENSSRQAHFGRSGLEMLSYDPRDRVGSLYLFDSDGRASAREQLLDDIPRLIARSGDAMTVPDFYEAIYNGTPAHSDDIHSALIENPDIEVITPAGGERRKPGSIGVEDFIRIKPQRSFFDMFSSAPQKAKKGPS
jgi:three-Cys-motif partner protein